MANVESIRAVLHEADLAVMEAECLAEVLTMGDDAPHWAYLFRYQIERISQTHQKLERILAFQALPILDDFNKSFGGGKK